MSTLFISHSSADGAAAVEVKRRLEARGHRSVFLDLDPAKGIQAGTSWERTLYAKLRACHAVLALCTSNYLSSHWCFAEVALARMEGKEVLALRLGPCDEGATLPSILTAGQYVDLRTDPETGYERLWRGFQAKGIVAAEHREWSPVDPPYPGLRAFEAADAPIFFGRETAVRGGVELLNRIRRQGQPRLALVLGASGSGKSSLTLAGIVPQLRRDPAKCLVIEPFRPGPRPDRSLASAFSRAYATAGKPRSWEAVLKQLERSDERSAATVDTPPVGPPSDEAVRARLRNALRTFEEELLPADAEVADTLHRLRAYLAGAPPGDRPAAPNHTATPATGGPLSEMASRLRLTTGPSNASILVVVDQLEELLGHEDQGPTHPANRVLRWLRDGLDEDSPLLVLATMRSDYLEAFQRSPVLQSLGFKSLAVGPITRNEMRRVIEEPARLGQVALEDGLTERLLDDTGTADALPLLAFTLRVMWNRYRDDGRLTIAEYDDLKGLRGAVTQVADDTLQTALLHGSESQLRRAFLRLGDRSTS